VAKPTRKPGIDKVRLQAVGLRGAANPQPLRGDKSRRGSSLFSPPCPIFILYWCGIVFSKMFSIIFSFIFSKIVS
jgi:hypothetical protein